MTEDVRRPLGRIAYEQREYARAAALWLQVVRDDPAWDDELREWILRAADRIPPSANRDTPADVNEIVSVGVRGLYFLEFIDVDGLGGTRVDADDVDAWRQDLQDRLTRLLDAMAHDRTPAADPRLLLASLDVERGLATMSDALKHADEEAAHRAALTVSAAIRAIGAAGTP